MCSNELTGDNYTEVSITPLIMLAPGSSHKFTIPSKHCVIEICNFLKAKFPNDTIVKRLIDHLNKMDKNAFRNYSDIYIILKNLSKTTIHFQTSRMEKNQIEYTIEHFDSEPPKELLPKKWYQRLAPW